MAVITFHIKKGRRRTTVSMERVLADLLSIRLGGAMDRSIVAKWSQEQVDEDPGAYERAASQRLASKAALMIAPKDVQERYWDGVLKAPRARRRISKRRRG